MKKILFVFITILCIPTAYATSSPDTSTSTQAESSIESPPQPQIESTVDESSLSPKEKAFLALEREALAVSTRGPARVPLLDQGVLNIPQGYLYIPIAQGRALMTAIGNTTGDTFQGLVLSEKEFLSWLIIVDFIKSGYIKDDEAKSWDANEMLQSFKDGTEEENKERVTRGMPEIEVVDWIQKPTYDAATHHMIFSILVRDKNGPANAAQAVNYNTYALGREGYFQLDLVGGSSTIDQDKKHALTMVSSLTYENGKSYTDFVEGTDHVAEYGLGALVLGVAAKKMGLLATLGILMAKFGKIGLIALFAGSAALKNKIKNLFGRKQNPDA